MATRTPLVLGASAGACALVLTVAAPVVAAPSAAGGDTAEVSVFHGVPGLTADVYANGDKLLSGFEPGTVTDPRPLDAGTYDIEVFPAGQGPGGTPAAEKQIKVPAGANATIAAHLSADGEPELTSFVDDVSQVDAGKARLTVRHVAAAPAVDVRADGRTVFTGLENPDQDTAVVDAGTVSAEVVPAGTDTVAIGPADLRLEEGADTIVYAWGSAADKNLAPATQTLSGMESAPKGVHAGGGAAAAAASTNSSDQWQAWAAATGVVTLTGVLVIRRAAGRRD